MASIDNELVEMESKIQLSTRPDFVMKDRAVPFLDHEVFIAVKQLNMDVLVGEARRRNTPGKGYSKWMTMTQVNSIRGNAVGRQAIADWLTANGVEITWTAAAGTYMKAKTTIGHWEHLLQTTFYMYEDQKTQHPLAPIPRADRYFLPSAIRDHVHAFFDVSELPPDMTYHSKISDVVVKRGFLAGKLYDVALKRRFVADQLYDAHSNTSSASETQSVFETNTQSFSPSDLTKFEETYSCQSTIDILGNASVVCEMNTGPNDGQCYESNLDTQSIMGMTHITTSMYYYVPNGGNTLLTYLTDMADMTEPIMFNVILWGSDEAQYSQASLDSFNNEAIALANMGFNTLVVNGDHGCQCIVGSGANILDTPPDGVTWTGQEYFPSFPGTSPYVTAVGATCCPSTTGVSKIKPNWIISEIRTQCLGLLAVWIIIGCCSCCYYAITAIVFFSRKLYAFLFGANGGSKGGGVKKGEKSRRGSK